jgi:hypothetical protein
MIWNAVRLWLLLTLATLLAAVLLRPAPTLAHDALNHLVTIGFGALGKGVF